MGVSKYDTNAVVALACERVWDVKNFKALAEALDMPKKSLFNCLVRVIERAPDETLFEALKRHASAVAIDLDSLSTEHELRYYRTRTTALEKRLASAEKWHDTFRDVAAMLRTDPVPVPKPPKKAEGKSHHIAMLHAADWHYGAWERRLGVLPGYDVSVAEDAIDQLFQRLVALLARLDYITVDAVIVNFLGDIVENILLREGQRRLTELPVAEQVVKVAYNIARNLKMLAGIYPQVHVGGVSGNHGRVTRKKGVSDPWDSFDWLVYRFVEALLSDQKNITFRFPRTWYIFYVLYGKHVVYGMHGAEIRSYVGFPWYGFGRAASNIAGMMTEEVKARIQQAEFTNTALSVDRLLEMLQMIPDTITIAHFHQEAFFRLQGKNAIAVNAMIPTTEFIAQAKFAMTRPSQTVSLFSKSRGRLVTNYQIWLDDVVRITSDAEMMEEPIMRVC